MSGIKTGNKGFVNPLDGKVYTVDPVAKGEDGVNVPSNLKSYDPGDMNVDQSIKDLGKQTKTTLGNYLSKATLGQTGASTTANAYPIDPPSESQQESSLLTEKGYPSPLTPASSGNSKKFAADIPSSISSNYAKGTNTVGKGADAVTTLLSKGKSEESATKKLLDGNELLPSVVKNQQKVVTLPGPLSAYTKESIDLNYRIPGTLFTADDILSPPKSFDPSLIRYGNLSKANPDVEAVVKGDLSLTLKDTYGYGAALTTGSKNPYPVVVPQTINSFSITDENGYPTIITPPSSINAVRFTNHPGSSVSNDYKEAIIKIENKTHVISKGKTIEASGYQLYDGHRLLQSVIKDNGVVKLPGPLKSYYEAAVDPNYRKPDDNFTIDDILSPPKYFDPKLLSYNNLLKVNPDAEAVVQTDLSLKLADVLKTPQSLTIEAKNDYPVIIKDNNIAFLTTNGFPSPITAPENQNEFIFTKNPGSSVSSDYAKAISFFNLGGAGGALITELIIKGKKEPKILQSFYNGNNLFDNVIKDKFGSSILAGPLESYYKAAIDPNTFNFKIPFTGKEENILQPVSSFFPLINEVNVFGKYYGREGEIISKDPVTLQELRKKAIDSTSGNEYPLAAPQDESVIALSSLTNTDGTPVSPAASKQDFYFPSANYYTPRQDINPSSDPNLNNFAKGKNVAAAYDGHNLLKTVDGNVNTVAGRFLPHKKSEPDVTYEENANLDESSKTAEFGQPLSQPAIPTDHPLNDYKVGPDASKSSVLALGNNRFSPRGVSSAKLNPTLKMIGTDGQLKEVSHMNMARVGIGLTQRAAGEIPAITADKFNPIGNEAEAGALIPGTAQLGFKVDDKLLQARDVLDSLTTNKDDEYDVDGLVSIAPGITFDGMASWGTLNSPSEPFDGGFSSVGLAVLMVLLVVLISAIFTAISYGDSKQAGKAKSSPDGQRVKGKYLFEESPSNAFTSFLPNAFEVFGLRQTNNDFRLCLGAGANAFFLGADNPQADFPTTIQGAAGILVDSLISDESKVGANIVVCRAIIRSSVIFAQYVDSIIRAGSNSGYAAARSTLSIVLKVIRSSKIISAMNVFASLGDVLIDRLNAIRIRNQQYTDANNKIQYSSGLDAIDPSSARATIQKNRLTFRSTYDSTLAWSAQRAPALYLINKDLDDLSLSKASGGEFLGPSGLEKKTKGGTDNSKNVETISAVNGRISDTFRQGFEKQLDSEYVPFYFHDVRTNEIISFHAFLASLSDDYTASYESTEGFGRVEPVKIYKGTTRKISMSFYVAALDEKDFDHMWAKINKLTTMVYPQYTQGRVLTAGTNQFIAPFSQLPGASPLIRIRLGDLLRSNYSKFGLARLFGAGSKRNSLGGMRIPDTNDQNASVDVIKPTNGNRSVMQLRREYIDDGIYDTDATIDVGVLTSYLQTNSIKELNNNPLPSTITFTADSNGKKVETTSPVQVKDPKIFKSNLDNGKITYHIKVDISKSVTDDGYEGTDTKNIILFNLPRSAIVLTQEHIESKFKIDDRISTRELSSFLNLGNNAIARSFESTGGKGLAGVIESMNFDWYDKVTWETTSSDDLGQAPKMCKVTLTFSPIHDITPGIDHMGYNRAPIYPVGRAMKSSS